MSHVVNSVGLPWSDMWLLDSGASVSVVSRDFLQGFQHSAIKTLVNFTGCQWNFGQRRWVL